MVRKCFWLEQSVLTPSAGWPSMRDCFNRSEDSSNYSAGVLYTNVVKNIRSIARREIKCQIPYVSWQWCLLCYGDHYVPCFLIVPPCIGFRWCSNAVKSFLYIYPYIVPLSSIQSKINGTTNGGTSYLYLLWSIEVKPSNGCSSDSISLFKTMLEWLANCSIEDSLF